MMKILLSFLLMFSFSAAATMQKTSMQLTYQIKNQGAQAVIADLYKDGESQWQYVLTKIGSGEQNWLDVAELLAPGSDADSAESLATAAATAIPHNPAGVLSLLKGGALPFSTDNVCALPFYSIKEPEFNQYVVDAIQALYKVPNSKACIDTIVNTIGQSNGFVEDN
ncbi:hypothetical protein [Rahnella victoriana]|nr:hypothetical protein [Rahnella victoriana]VTQ53556.1 Uncharacterised protein [Campylobacter jejuni]